MSNNTPNVVMVSVNVDLSLLREQRDFLINGMDENSLSHCDEVEGIVNLLDAMLDVAEGYNIDE